MLASDLLPKLHIDDPVEAFAVHGACARRARRRSVAGGMALLWCWKCWTIRRRVPTSDLDQQERAARSQSDDLDARRVTGCLLQLENFCYLQTSVQTCLLLGAPCVLSEPRRCGIWGTLAAALFDWGVPQQKWHGWGGFSPTDGATLGSGLAANVAGIFAIMAWSGTLLGLVRPAALCCLLAG